MIFIISIYFVHIMRPVVGRAKGADPNSELLRLFILAGTHAPKPPAKKMLCSA